MLQYIKFIEWIGLENNSFFRIIIGTSYSFIDIICYAAGSAITGIIELVKLKKVI